MTELDRLWNNYSELVKIIYKDLEKADNSRVQLDKQHKASITKVSYVRNKNRLYMVADIIFSDYRVKLPLYIDVNELHSDTIPLLCVILEQVSLHADKSQLIQEGFWDKHLQETTAARLKQLNKNFCTFARWFQQQEKKKTSHVNLPTNDEGISKTRAIYDDLVVPESKSRKAKEKDKPRQLN